MPRPTVPCSPTQRASASRTVSALSFRALSIRFAYARRIPDFAVTCASFAWTEPQGKIRGYARGVGKAIG